MRNSLILQVFVLLLAGAPMAFAQATTRPYVVHIPGIGGILAVDNAMAKGLVQGGVNADITMVDWSAGDRGIAALHARDRNELEAGKVADMLVRRMETYPGSRVVLTSHSGGGAIAVWALEKLPAGDQVDDAFLMAPALSPGYDLSAALKHVRGKMYVFWSTGDELVLGIGCRMCGTMDGKLTDAAGRVSFSQPSSADADQYKKLDQRAYDPAWVRLGNLGDHIGPMARLFAKAILAPLVIGPP
ncbi:MAG: hypothetical protein ABSH22_05480 [Tepidisphaeraceae bacterium]